MRSGTKPVKDDYKLTDNKEINMADVKPKEPEKAEEVYEYTYEYEEITESEVDDDESYHGGDDDD